MQFNLSKISDLKPAIVNVESIKNIIFDFGGVICNIDVNLTRKAMLALGWNSADPGHALSDAARLFEGSETGALSSQQFRDELKKHFVNPVTDDQIDQAWNALLLDIPGERIRLMEDLRKNHRIFLLSNTNEIHYRKYVMNFSRQFGYADFDALFSKAYFSHRIGLKKPSPEIFRYVLQDRSLVPSETLFIDDTLVHVEGARNAGIYAYHLALDRGEQVTDLFL